MHSSSVGSVLALGNADLVLTWQPSLMQAIWRGRHRIFPDPVILGLTARMIIICQNFVRQYLAR